MMIPFWFVLLLFGTTLTTFAQNSESKEINWPSKYEPSKSKFYVHNEIEINAKPEVVWGYLIDALRWQSWYVGSKNVSFLHIEDTLLTANTIFKWETMGLKFQSTIREFEPNRLLAWESKKKSIQGYHVWLIKPTEKGCIVVTDESQNGWLTFFEKLFQGKKLKNLHYIWLLELKKKAEGSSSTMTEFERSKLRSTLAESSLLFNESVSSLSTTQLNFRPANGGWTIAECIEHIALAELESAKIIEAEMKSPANPKRRSEIKIADDEIKPKMTSRHWKAKSPDIFKPSKKFKRVEESIMAFQSQRKKTIDYIEATKDDVRNRYWRHPLTGTIDLYQMLVLMSAHVDRHLEQISSIKKSSGFPTT